MLRASGGGVRAVITCRQVDLKSLIAYSSVVHMALVTTTCVYGVKVGSVGATLIVVAHGVCRSGLFLTATQLYRRLNTRRVVLGRGLL